MQKIPIWRRLAAGAALTAILAVGFPGAAQGQEDPEKEAQEKPEQGFDEPFAPAVVEPNPEEIEDPTDHEVYAKRFGVSPDEALHRQGLREQIGVIAAELIDRYPESVAGFEIVHEPNYMFEVWIVGDPTPEVSAVLGRASDSGIPVSVLPGRKHSLEDLRAAGDALATDLDRYGSADGWTIALDGKNGELVVEVSQELAGLISGDQRADADDVLRTLESADLTAGADASLSISRAPGPLVESDAYVHGGSWLGGWGTNMKVCRTGFTVYMWDYIPPVGWVMSNGLLTAAHCKSGIENGVLTNYGYQDHGTTYNGNSSSYIQMFYYGHSYGPGDGDIMAIQTVDSPTATYRPYSPDSTPRWNVTAEVAWGDYMAGDWFCAWSKHTNIRTCTTVDNPFYSGSRPGGVTVSWSVLMTGDLLAGGDSGGPWSYSGLAAGVHSASLTSNGADMLTRIADRYKIGNVYLYTS